MDASDVGRARSRGKRGLWVVLRVHPHATLVLLLAPLYVLWIAAIPLDGTLEGNRLEVAREMLRSGDWLVPRLGGVAYLAKPPLHPWTLAVASWPFGEVHLATGRIVSAMAAIATCCLVLAWGRREFGARAGWFAALALGISPLVVGKASRAELESELTLFTTLALFALWDAGRSNARAAVNGLRLGAGLALGAALLVKGPPALIVFLCGALAASGPRERRPELLVSAFVAVGLGLAVALLWIVPLCARLGFAEAWVAFDGQFLGRISHAGRTNVEPLWFYVPALLAALVPAVVFLPCLALVLPGRSPEPGSARSRSAFLWGWALLPLILFSASSGKETRYLLPTLPAWMLLLAWGWIRARTSSRFLGLRHGLARTLGIATWVVPVAWCAAGLRFYPEKASVVVATAVCALLGRLVLAWSVGAGKPAIVFGTLVLVVVTAKVAWAGTALAKQRAESPVEEVARAIADRLSPGEAWILIGPYRSWWHFTVNRPCLVVPEWDQLAAARARAVGPRASYALVREESIPPTEEARGRVGRWIVGGDAYWVVRLEL